MVPRSHPSIRLAIILVAATTCIISIVTTRSISGLSFSPRGTAVRRTTSLLLDRQLGAVQRSIRPSFVASCEGNTGIGIDGVWRAPSQRFEAAPQTKSGRGLDELKVNDVFEGKIMASKNFGAFVNIGFERDGLLPSRELRKINPSPERGDSVQVRVAEVDLGSSRFRLSAVIPEPKLNTENIKEGEVVEGTVKFLTKFGAFIDVGAGKDGLLHSSWFKSTAYASGIPSIGEKIKVSVQRIDTENNKLILGAPSGEGGEGKAPPTNAPLRNQDLTKYKQAVNNQKFQATVLSLKPYGAILSLDNDGVRGLLPLRFASPDRINSVSEVLAVGDKLSVYVLGVDERGISFSTRPITGRTSQPTSRGGGNNKKVKTTFSVGGVSINLGKEMKEAVEYVHGKDDAPSSHQQASAGAAAGAAASTSAQMATTPFEDEATVVDDDEVEVEERIYEGQTYLVDPTTNEVYTEEGEVVGEWDGEEPVFY
mmetsp:Transcript_11713/g.18773  ORF Transcript_11713/g.18773 Transcript_11713/m.18773 type:complete len:481 (+) Transcript_11713:48-1490(+)